MALNTLSRLVALWCGGLLMHAAAVAGEAVAPPTTEEAQAAYARFATGFVSRLIKAGVPTELSGGKFAEINELAHRQALRGCDDRREPDIDPFAPPDAPPPPVVFNCTWESGERISLTRLPNTGAWMVSDDATAAAGAGILLVGPKQEAPKVVAVPSPPKQVPEAPAAIAPGPAAVAVVQPPPVYSGANLQAMPSPFVPPVRTEPGRSTATSTSSAGPMPTPFGSPGR